MKNILDLRGMPRDIITLEIRAKFADLGLAAFVRGKVPVF